MKNILTISVRIAVFSAFILCLLAGYIYTRDYGVDYKGRARLHYNWAYVFAERPKHMYDYNSELFSFSCMTVTKDDPILIDSGEADSLLGHHFGLHWYPTGPATIKSELASYLAAADRTDWTPSVEFQKWLFGATDIFSATKADKLKFKDGTPAALIIVKAKRSGWRGNFRYLVSISPSGVIIKAKNTLNSAVSYDRSGQIDLSGVESYSPYLDHIRPDPKRDFQNFCIFNRFIETFRFKR